MSQYSTAYLSHHGIKGQKWGVRRYQNEDGLLTAEGRARYLKNLSDKDRRAYEKLERTNPKAIQHINKQLDQGKSYREAVQSYTNKRHNQAAAIFAAGSILAAGAAVYLGSGKAQQHIASGSKWLAKTLSNTAFSAKNKLKFGVNVRRI